MLYYLYSGDGLLGFIYNGNTYYYHKNVFGDILGILNSTYEELVTYEYDSWGVISNITDTSGINLGTINPFRYRSYYYDEETKLYYLNSRYYNPEWGRFINGDIVITGQSIHSANIFLYCDNNSINRNDVSGKWFTNPISEPKHYKKVKGFSLFDIIKETIINKKTKSDLQKKTQNCYAYATNLSDGFLNPGRKNLGDKFTLEELKKEVIKDQKNAGREVREVDGPNSKLKSNEYMIAMRITENPIILEKDYHFMVRDDDGIWSEKKGFASSKKVYGTPESFGAWSPRMNSKTVYLAITKD